MLSEGSKSSNDVDKNIKKIEDDDRISKMY